MVDIHLYIDTSQSSICVRLNRSTSANNLLMEVNCFALRNAIVIATRTKNDRKVVIKTSSLNVTPNEYRLRKFAINILRYAYHSLSLS